MDSRVVTGLCEGLEDLGSIDELERRLELASCLEIDTCLAQYCWQFATGYPCSTECTVQCEPFNGCHPYCVE